MVTCPDGHRSLATDYCDVCGSPIEGPATGVALCPSCRQPSSGRFCEACGHDSALGASGEPLPSVGDARPTVVERAPDPSTVPENPPVIATVTEVRHIAWIATITADREFYDRVVAREGPDTDRVDFPSYFPQRRITLRGTDILIGKRSVSQGVQPDIDLGLAPADAGVSRAHAMLRLTPTALTITDLGSTNGTSLNGSDDLIPADTPVPLRSGDRIHLGAWTTITLSTEPG
ncbi:FHA domain-containing protein [Nocardia sp. NPDC005366]|uniref:FHA domain-containing protein n=1 Tax=Nocardia sp. NPDC005366 TaxID=3156878 RepID=UPI0033BB5149